jgi:hypothetical protein
VCETEKTSLHSESGQVCCTVPTASAYALCLDGATEGLSQPYAMFGGWLIRSRRRVSANMKGLEVLRPNYRSDQIRI